MRQPGLARAKLAVALVLGIALLGTLYYVPKHYLLAVNTTTSLPGTLYLIDTGQSAGPFARGDIVAFAFDGSVWGLPANKPWAKRVAGLPGDVIEQRDSAIWVNGKKVAQLNPPTMLRGNLSPTSLRRVPAGRLFVVGQTVDSFDSRYREFGNIPATAIIGPAVPLL